MKAKPKVKKTYLPKVEPMIGRSSSFISHERSGIYKVIVGSYSRPILTERHKDPFDVTKRIQTAKLVKEPDKKANLSLVKESRISNYIIGAYIGKGAYAIVKKAQNKKTKEIFAIKLYEKICISDTQTRTSINREINLLKRLDHPHIVKLYEVIDTPKILYIIMELAQGKPLRDLTKHMHPHKLEEKDAIKIFKQILSGIEYCHSHNVTHRDIKLENILADENLNVKIIDFGFSVCVSSTQKLRIFCGTPTYMAPEIIRKKDYYGPPTDIWSLGVVFYYLLTGQFPFKGTTETELYRNVSKGIFVYTTEMSTAVRNLLGKMLEVVPEKRATASELMKETMKIYEQKL